MQPETDAAMARISKAMFDNKAGRAVGKLLGISAGATVDRNGFQAGPEHGQHDGQQDGAAHGEPDGFQDGAHNGVGDGFHDGVAQGFQDGRHHGAPNGTQHGTQHDASNGRTLEEELGVEFHTVNGVVVACEPGQAPPLEPIDQAEVLLTWMMGQEQFVGKDVPSKTLEQMLYPYLAKKMGWEPFTWRLVAAELGLLPGVGVRQRDQRRGADRKGPTPTVYYIPFPEEARQAREDREQIWANLRTSMPDPAAAVVELAAAGRKRA